MSNVEDELDNFFANLAIRAATIDEILSGDFESLPGQKKDATKAGHRLSVWCNAASGGDWSLFERRLERDGLTFGHVLGRFATSRRVSGVPIPAWLTDAMWVDAAIRRPQVSARYEAPKRRREVYRSKIYLRQ